MKNKRRERLRPGWVQKWAISEQPFLDNYFFHPSNYFLHLIQNVNLYFEKDFLECKNLHSKIGVLEAEKDAGSKIEGVRNNCPFPFRLPRSQLKFFGLFIQALDSNFEIWLGLYVNNVVQYLDILDWWVIWAPKDWTIWVSFWKKKKNWLLLGLL